MDIPDYAEQVARHLMVLLDRMLSERVGSKRQAAAYCGVCPSALRGWIRRWKTVPMYRVLQIMVLLGKRPQDLLRLDEEAVNVRALLATPAWGRRPPNLIRQVGQIARNLPLVTQEALLDTPEIEGLALRLRHDSLRQRRDWLAAFNQPGPVLAAAEALEEYRQSAPTEALSLARALVEHACPQLKVGANQAFCRAAGVLGSACRMLGDLPAAAEILRLAIAVAKYPEQPPLLADLYQRAGYVLFDRVQFEAALDAVDAAGRLYQRLGDAVGQAKVRADRGIFLTAAGQAEAALQELRQALEELPAAAGTYRLAAYFHLGRALASLGRHREAGAALASAESLLDPAQVFNRACLLYEEATAQRAGGNPEGSAQALKGARDLLRGLNPFDQASVTLDLVEMLLDLGQRAEAVAEARGMARLLKPFAACSPIAEAAMATFLRRAAQVGRADVQTVRRALARARPQQGGPIPGG
jgi:tetratricopeptide (TPR) repeat protein